MSSAAIILALAWVCTIPLQRHFYKNAYERSYVSFGSALILELSVALSILLWIVGVVALVASISLTNK